MIVVAVFTIVLMVIWANKKINSVPKTKPRPELKIVRKDKNENR